MEMNEWMELNFGWVSVSHLPLLVHLFAFIQRDFISKKIFQDSTGYVDFYYYPIECSIKLLKYMEQSDHHMLYPFNILFCTTCCM